MLTEIATSSLQIWLSEQPRARRKTDMNELSSADWNLVANADGEISCDAALDLEQPTPDGLRNFVEERYDTNPLQEDSDGDLSPIDTRLHLAQLSWGFTVASPFSALSVCKHLSMNSWRRRVI